MKLKKWHLYAIGIVIVLITLFIFGWKAATILGIGAAAGGYKTASKQVQKQADQEKEVVNEAEKDIDKRKEKDQELQKEAENRKEKANQLNENQKDRQERAKDLDSRLNEHKKE
jgi:Skp family chaperone for outer membrane proteins